MTADADPIDVEAEAAAWLRRRLAALDPAWLVIRGVDGRVVVELPRNGREVEGDPATDGTH
jgi:hypothetical protein